MDTMMNRSVDVGETRARPGLALFLALLSVPGTTMVWDLDVPLPGFWIGLPLGVAAIVLALRARREPITKAGRGMTIGAIILSTLAIGQMLIWTAVEVASAEAPAATTLTFTELEKGGTFKHVRNTKSKSSRANLLGDLIVFTSPIADSAGKTVGKLHATCVTTVGSSDFLKSKLICSGVMALGKSSLTLQAITSPGTATTTGAITGGTGIYANARGVFTSVEGRNGNSADTITLVP